jgi:hypothetical protein
MSDCNDISDDDSSSSHHSSNYNSFKDNSSKDNSSKDNSSKDNLFNGDHSIPCQRKEAKQPEQPRLPFAVKSAPPPLRGVVKRTPPTSPTSSPSKRPRRLARPSTSATTTTTTPAKSPVLELLQSKKKGQRSGLYQWVLWREALKGEKDRKNEDPSERTCVIRNLNNSFTKTSTI